MILIMKRLKKKYSDQPSYVTVHLSALPAYVFTAIMITNQLYDFIPDGWNSASTLYNPVDSVPENGFENLDNKSSLNDITFVTAYFDLGTFQKGDGFSKKPQGPEKYMRWMSALSMFNNTIIVYTDSANVGKKIEKMRSHFDRKMTLVKVIERGSLWSFQQASKIQKIYSQPLYPKFSPNTVNENYSCVMHAKFDLIEKVIKEKIAKTSHLGWIDLGYFRSKEVEPFKLTVPQEMYEDHIAFTQIFKHYDYMPNEIIAENAVWVAGGLFFGQPKYLLTFISDYRRSVQSLIQNQLMDTDQQVIYFLYSQHSQVKPRVKIQSFYHKCRCDWFYLGNLCRYKQELQSNTDKPLSNFISYVI